MSDYRNQPGSFWAAGSQPQAAVEALTETWRLEGVTTTALLTGAARYVVLFGAESWPVAMGQVAADGPKFIVQQVRNLENSDPNQFHSRRSKVHDDATIAAIDLDRH